MGDTHASKDQLPLERVGDHEGRMAQFGDYNVAFETVPAGFPPDPSAAFAGLPDDACQCEHWGYVFKGSFRMEFTDGREIVVSAGEAYYIPAGHRFQALEDLELVEFSPKAEFDRTVKQVSENLEAMQATS